MPESNPNTSSPDASTAGSIDDPLSYQLAEAEFVSSGDQFLPLTGRRVLYVLGLAGLAIAPVLAVTNPDYAVAVTSSATLLGTAALGTALANPTR